MSGKRKDYITWDEYFMAVARLAGLRSKDPNSQVGSIQTLKPEIIYFFCWLF